MSAATIYRGYCFKLFPTEEQARHLEKISGNVRAVYNLALEQRRDYWRQFRANTGKSISFFSQDLELTDLRAQFEWVRAAPRTCQSAALQDLDAAFSSFLQGRKGYPKMKSKLRDSAFRMRGAHKARRLNAKWGALRVSGIGFIKFRYTRELIGKMKGVTVSRRADGWYASFCQEIESVPAERHPSSVGIDRGVAATLTLSSGEALSTPSVADIDKRRVFHQRALARRKKGSRRHALMRAEISRLYAAAARVRADWCHRTTTDIARRHGLVAMEDLKVQQMTTSARGTVDAPGVGVRAKAGLNRAIREQSWGRLKTLLDYKLTERGGHLISVPAAYTSQTCASCGVVDARSRKSQAVFACVHCDHTDNADVNAAKEILRRSTAWLDVEGRFVGPPKRQPGETRTGKPGKLKISLESSIRGAR